MTPFKGPQPRFVSCFRSDREGKGTTPPSRTTYANLDNVLVENIFVFIAPKIRGAPLGPLAAIMSSVFVMVYEVDEKSSSGGKR